MQMKAKLMTLLLSFQALQALVIMLYSINT